MKYFVTEYEKLRGVFVPFDLTFQGVVYKFGTDGRSNSDKAVLIMYLQDSKGDLLQVAFHDQWAEGSHLKVQNKLQVYFAKVFAGKNDRSKEITVWVFSDAYVHVVEYDVDILSQGKEIKLTVA